MPLAAPLEDAAGGRLPPWTQAAPQRRAHMARVASLLDEWAGALGLSGTERKRWRAAGYLHDALRDAPPAELRPLVPVPLRQLADPLLHGPAAAERLRLDGVADDEVLEAIAWHTTGHPALAGLGRALVIADAIEPGRTHDAAVHAALRARMPAERDAVLAEVVRSRMAFLRRQGRAIAAETTALLDSLDTAVAPGSHASRS